MNRSKTAIVHDITDTVNLQYQPGGYRIYKIRTAVNHIGCERAEDKSYLVFGEYTFFLLLRSMVKKYDYSIKAIRCPFIKTVPISEKLMVFSNSSNLQVSLSGPPECTFDQMDAKPVNKNLFYRIALAYQVEFWEPGEGENTSLSEALTAEESPDPGSPDSGSVKVWRVDSSQNHTIEQLLGIDRDTLIEFNKNHTRD